MENSYTSGQLENTTSQTSTPNAKPHLKTLSEHKHVYDFFMRSQELVGFHAHIQDAVFNAYLVVDPYFHVNRTCPACLVEALIKVYKWFENESNS